MGKPADEFYEKIEMIDNDDDHGFVIEDEQEVKKR